MPETRECTCHGLHLQEYFDSHSSRDWTVISLHYDATNSESAKSVKSSRIRRHLIDTLSPNSKVRRGSTNAQTPLFPPSRRTTNRALFATALRGLVLRAVHYMNRAIELDLTEDWCQVCWLH